MASVKSEYMRRMRSLVRHFTARFGSGVTQTENILHGLDHGGRRCGGGKIARHLVFVDDHIVHLAGGRGCNLLRRRLG